ncbi:MAG: DUF1800 family protein, partial [Planctomycetota bacterium]
QERLAWFLHDHFATSDLGFPADSQWWFNSHVNLFRRFSLAPSDKTGDGMPGLGYDWEKILAEVAKDRAMLNWLDGRVSTKAAPNENFARELWELFMLGEGNGYTEADIQAAAKAFTGFEWWTDRPRRILPDGRREMRYRSGARHDAGNKTIFGVTGKFGYDSVGPFYWEGNTSTGDYDTSVDADPADTDGGVVALTLRERPDEAADFICRKLAEFFLYDDPHDVVVNALAADLKASGPNQWNLEPILRRILQSKAMYSAYTMKAQVQSPVEYAVGFMRTANVDLHPTSISFNTSRLELRLRANLGQVVLQPPDVNGWPRGTAWLSSQAMLERMNFITYAIEQLDSFPDQIEPLIPPENLRSPVELVDHLAAVLDVELSATARTQAINYVTTQESGGRTIPFAYDQNDPADVKMKTRGLLWLIAQYHDGHQN